MIQNINNDDLFCLIFGAVKTQPRQPFFNFGNPHEQIPNKMRTVIFNHDDNGSFVDGQVGLCIPVSGLAEPIGEAIRSPNLAAQVFIKVPKRLHAVLGGIRKGG